MANRIDYFVHLHGFYADNGKFLPCEIGIGEIWGTESIKLLTIDLSRLKFDLRDIEGNFKLHRFVHGVPAPTYKDLHKDFRFDLHHDNLPNYMYCNYGSDVVFAVRGPRQKRLLQEITSNEVVDIQCDLGLMRKIYVEPRRTPTLHKRFHADRCEHRCAAKIAWTYAEFLRDRIFGYALPIERPATPQPIQYSNINTPDNWDCWDN